MRFALKHVDENAELYALGMLSDAESQDVERHARSCTTCRGRVANARETVTRIAQEEPPYEPSPNLRARIANAAAMPQPVAGALRPRWLLLASGIVAGVAAASLVFLPFGLTAQRAARENDLAISAIVTSHFSHVSFEPLEAQAPQAKILYERHGAWLYVLVRAPQKGMAVGLEIGSRVKTVGPLTELGENGMLLVGNPGHVTAVVLRLNGKSIARATVSP